jgi:hypothetical protein
MREFEKTNDYDLIYEAYITEADPMNPNPDMPMGADVRTGQMPNQPQQAIGGRAAVRGQNLKQRIQTAAEQGGPKVGIWSDREAEELSDMLYGGPQGTTIIPMAVQVIHGLEQKGLLVMSPGVMEAQANEIERMIGLADDDPNLTSKDKIFIARQVAERGENWRQIVTEWLPGHRQQIEALKQQPEWNQMLG